MPPLLLEKYIDSAEAIVEQLFSTRAGGGSRSTRYEGEVAAEKNKTPNEHVRRAGSSQKAAGIYSNQELSVIYQASVEGDYVLRARAWGGQAGPETVRMGFRIAGKTVGEAQVKAVSTAPAIYEVRVRLEEGEHRFGVAFLNDYFQPESPNPALRGDRNLFVDWFEVQLVETDRAPAETSDLIARPLMADGRPHAANIRKTIERFATRAWRRPLQPGELDRYVQLGRTVYDNEGTVEDAIQVVFQAALSSPFFSGSSSMPSRKTRLRSTRSAPLSWRPACPIFSGAACPMKSSSSSPPAAAFWRPGCSGSRPGECCVIPARSRWRRILPSSGCRRAFSMARRRTRTSFQASTRRCARR